VGVAARALTRPQHATETGGSTNTAADLPRRAAQPDPVASFADVSGVATRELRDEPADRFQTSLAMTRVLLTRLKAHTTTVIAGSLAYYALLAVFPAVIAAVSIYGLVAEPADLANLIDSLADKLPQATSQVISDELSKIVSSSETGLGIGVAIGILAALWSASAGAKVLITGVNLAYGEKETRSYLVVRGLALALTIGMVVGVVVVVAGVAVLPQVVDSTVAGLLRWPALIALVVIGLAALYRIAPADAMGRNHPIWQGAFGAAVVWLGATAGFTAAVGTFGRFNATYGALAGVVILLIWFFLSGLIVLLGAEFNAAIETRRNRLATSTG